MHNRKIYRIILLAAIVFSCILTGTSPVLNTIPDERAVAMTTLPSLCMQVSEKMLGSNSQGRFSEHTGRETGTDFSSAEFLE